MRRCRKSWASFRLTGSIGSMVVYIRTSHAGVLAARRNTPHQASKYTIQNQFEYAPRAGGAETAATVTQSPRHPANYRSLRPYVSIELVLSLAMQAVLWLCKPTASSPDVTFDVNAMC
eukprot:1689788-Pleurochrysis_carterae.AAC.3